jgi:hypothetical protein
MTAASWRGKPFAPVRVQPGRTAADYRIPGAKDDVRRALRCPHPE